MESSESLNPYAATTAVAAPIGRKLRIRRISAFSVAMTLGALYACVNLVVGALMVITGNPLGILFPVIGGVLGFLGSGLLALLYNALAAVIGGIVIEVDQDG